MEIFESVVVYGLVKITTCEYINNIKNYTTKLFWIEHFTIAQTQYRKFLYIIFLIKRTFNTV
jgi:hypothetical protein